MVDCYWVLLRMRKHSLQKISKRLQTTIITRVIGQGGSRDVFEEGKKIGDGCS